MSRKGAISAHFEPCERAQLLIMPKKDFPGSSEDKVLVLDVDEFCTDDSAELDALLDRMLDIQVGFSTHCKQIHG